MSDPSTQTLFRYQVVSQVLSLMHQGRSRSDAVRAAASELHFFGKGHLRRASARSIYRWLTAYEENGIQGLEPGERKSQSISVVLPARFMDFLVAEKKKDPKASVPELIRRARELGILDPEAVVDRTTVYRTCLKLGLSAARRKRAKDRDARRFAYPHRLDMVLCDGKYFRAGVTRARRVAMVFFDDASRFVLHLVVGTSENAALFQRGLFECIQKYGLMSIIYFDHGPGFIAEDTLAVISNLGALFIHGEKAYPEGHGKVERFNQTFLMDLLRGLDGRPDVDPGCRSLELRLQHYAHKVYAHRPHEGLGGETPWQRFSRDEKALRFPEDEARLREKFEIYVKRRVSNDHIVSIDSVLYEMPRGYAGQKVILRQRLLEGTLAFLHQGKVIELHPVDLAANARSHRGRKGGNPDEKESQSLHKSAADMAFERDFKPVVDADGGFTDPNEEEIS